MKIHTRLALLCLGGVCSSPAIAHHGSTAQYDQSVRISVSGTVTNLRWVNPHSYVYFDVTDDSGEVREWRCEMRAAAVLERSGWSSDMFRVGARIEVQGAAARREKHVCYLRQFSIDGGPPVRRYEQLEEAEGDFDPLGRPATLPNGQPNITGNWAAPQRLLQEGEVRRRSRKGFRGFDYEQSPAGEKAAENFNARRDNPRYNCQPVNIVRDWIFDQHINRIEQHDDRITLTYGFMDIVRTIHLDRDEHPDDVAPSRAGHSIGHWRGNTLIVETTGFLPGYLDGRFGINHSDKLHIVERFSFDPDNLSLLREYTGTDPLFLDAPFSDQDVVFLTNTPYKPYDCEDLTTDFGVTD